MSIFIGVPIALFASLLVLLPTALTWTFLVKVVSRYTNSTRLAATFVAPFSLASGNIFFVFAAGLIMASDPLEPTFIGGAVGFGTPVAVLATPFLAWFIYRKEHNGA